MYFGFELLNFFEPMITILYAAQPEHLTPYFPIFLSRLPLPTSPFFFSPANLPLPLSLSSILSSPPFSRSALSTVPPPFHKLHLHLRPTSPAPSNDFPQRGAPHQAWHVLSSLFALARDQITGIPSSHPPSSPNAPGRVATPPPATVTW